MPQPAAPSQDRCDAPRDEAATRRVERQLDRLGESGLGLALGRQLASVPDARRARRCSPPGQVLTGDSSGTAELSAASRRSAPSIARATRRSRRSHSGAAVVRGEAHDSGERGLWPAGELRGAADEQRRRTPRWPAGGDPDRSGQRLERVHAGRSGDHGRRMAAGRRRLPPGPSRIIEASYAGSATILPASGYATVITPARIRITRVTPDRTGWGHTVTIRGRVLGGYIPASSKLLRLDLGIVGIPGFSKIQGIPNIAPDGTFTTRYKFAGGLSGVARFWLQVSSLPEADFPWAAARSPRVIVTVGVPTPRRRRPLRVVSSGGVRPRGGPAAGWRVIAYMADGGGDDRQAPRRARHPAGVVAAPPRASRHVRRRATRRRERRQAAAVGRRSA